MLMEPWWLKWAGTQVCGTFITTALENEYQEVIFLNRKERKSTLAMYTNKYSLQVLYE